MSRSASLRAGLRRKEGNLFEFCRHDYAALDSLRSFSGQALKPCPDTCLSCGCEIERQSDV